MKFVSSVVIDGHSSGGAVYHSLGGFHVLRRHKYAKIVHFPCPFSGSNNKLMQEKWCVPVFKQTFLSSHQQVSTIHSTCTNHTILENNKAGQLPKKFVVNFQLPFMHHTFVHDDNETSEKS